MLKYFRSLNPKWPIIWISLYLSFSILAIFLPGSFIVAFLRCSGIFLNLVFVLIYFRKDYLLDIALGFTLIADLILAFDNVSVYGLLMFCFVQFFHFIRLEQITKKSIKPSMIFTYLIFAATIFIVGFSIVHTTIIYILATIYFPTLAYNIYLSFRWQHINPKSTAPSIAIIGFILFFACDTCVGVSYFSSIAVLPAAIQPFANYFAWFFYYPSQIFVANSSKLNKSMLQ